METPWLPNPPAKKGSADYLAWAQEAFIELIRNGWNYSQASDYLGYGGYPWVYATRRADPAWWDDVQKARTGVLRKFEVPDLSRMPFQEFVSEYFGIELAEHQLRMASALEDPLGSLVMILGHPESGKSTLVSLWYPVYRLCQDLDTRIALVSKSSPKADALLTRVKRYLTEEHLYADTNRNLIADFNGFKPAHGTLPWGADQIYVRHRKSGERDPTIQALGIGKQIYGTRLDRLILDDSLVLDNQVSATQRETLDRWFTSEARSRALKGQTVINGTRLYPPDLYGVWRKRWADHPLYREVIVPAILDEGGPMERPSWPAYWDLKGHEITEEINGEQFVVGYSPGLHDIRAEFKENLNQWLLVYQQENVEQGGTIFSEAHTAQATALGANRNRGQFFDHERLILSVDPATKGRAAALVIAVDPLTKIRTVIDGVSTSNLGTTGIRKELFYRWWERYRDHGIALTVVETNFAPTLMGDVSFLTTAYSYGTHVQTFTTTGRGRKRGSKWDEEYGVGAMASLVSGGLIAFASGDDAAKEMIAPLVQDMLVFPYAAPTGDSLMALWFGVSVSEDVFLLNPINQEKASIQRGVPPHLIARQRR